MNKTYKEFLLEAGQAPGKLELVKTNVDMARKYALQAFEKAGKDLDEELPDFQHNYQSVQQLAMLGKTKRKDMPVIDAKDIKDFQKRLSSGMIDINKPFSDITQKNSDPFPEGLAGGKAKEWLEAGIKLIKLHDGDKKDDIIKVTKAKLKMGELLPIQQQIYFDKSLQTIIDFGVKGSKSFLTGKSFFIVSSDYYIIDGHHRWLAGNLIDLSMKTQVLIIDLPMVQLLPLSLAYGDARGNKRNA
jgi:hypothetical protein